jgi:hypothetical protein
MTEAKKFTTETQRHRESPIISAFSALRTTRRPHLPEPILSRDREGVLTQTQEFTTETQRHRESPIISAFSALRTTRRPHLPEPILSRDRKRALTHTKFTTETQRHRESPIISAFSALRTRQPHSPSSFLSASSTPALQKVFSVLSAPSVASKITRTAPRHNVTQ